MSQQTVTKSTLKHSACKLPSSVVALTEIYVITQQLPGRSSAGYANLWVKSFGK